METYNGHVRTPTDAIILFEACRLGLLPRVQRRLSEKERQSIRSGSVFVWDEREAGMRRWTDGKSWSASRVSGSFLTYREMEGKRGGNNFVQPVPSRGAKTPDSGRNSGDDPADGEEGPDGYRYKPDGLMKQSFSITTTSGQHLHLISYYSRSHPTAPNLRQPSNDPTLASIQIPKGMYPESSVADQSNTPAVTRSPMPGAPNYAMAPSPAFARQPPPPPYAFYPGYFQHPSGFLYPVSPMHTPPGYPIHAYGPISGLPPPPGHPNSPFAPPHPPPPPPINHAPPSAYDQRPLRNSIPTPGEVRTPATLQHNSTAPPTYGVPQNSHSPSTPGQTLHRTPSSMESAPPAPQIDPRLTDYMAVNSSTPPVYSSVPTPSPASAPPSMPINSLPSPKSVEQPAHSTVTELTVPASHAPTIGALVNETSSTPSLAKGLSTVTTTEITLPSRKENDRAGSSSPGGTKHSVPPQDIPSEKLGFREDMRALSKLDRVFTRV